MNTETISDLKLKYIKYPNLKIIETIGDFKISTSCRNLLFLKMYGK